MVLTATDQISQYITTIAVMRWVPRPLLILAFGVGAGL